MSELIRIPNINNYIFEIIDNELILTPKKIYINESELLLTDISGSKIQECLIKYDNEIISSRIITSSIKIPWTDILIDIWKSMPIQIILKNSKFNFKLTKETLKGYRWCQEIEMSFQNKDAKGSLNEIINMVKFNKYSLNMNLKLKTDEEIYFKIE